MPETRQQSFRGLRRCLPDSRGSVLLEAAITFPVLVVLLIAGAEFNEAYTVRRKVAAAANTMADLAAQEKRGDIGGDIGDIQAAGALMVGPYSTTPLATRVSAVWRDKDGKESILCSYASGGMAASDKGTAFELPANLAANNEAVFVAETSYTFTPAVGMFLVGGITFSSVHYYKPRVPFDITAPAC